MATLTVEGAEAQQSNGGGFGGGASGGSTAIVPYSPPTSPYSPFLPVTWKGVKPVLIAGTPDPSQSGVGMSFNPSGGRCCNRCGTSPAPVGLVPFTSTTDKAALVATGDTVPCPCKDDKMKWLHWVILAGVAYVVLRGK